MSLQQHIEVYFKDLYFFNKINFFNLWKDTYKTIYPEKNLDFNNVLMSIRITKSFYLCKYFLSVYKLEGDFLECGVLRGFSSYLLKSLEQQVLDKKIDNYFLIDSFEGLSELHDEDISSNKDYIFRKGDLKEGIEKVEKIFEAFDNTYLIKGWIPDVFSLLDNTNKYKFVHLDVDLYKPTLDSLIYIYDKVVEGGIIITDDYQSPMFPGNQKAWKEFFNSINLKNWLALPSGQAVIIKE